jgi:hypothetical protein
MANGERLNINLLLVRVDVQLCLLNLLPRLKLRRSSFSQSTAKMSQMIFLPTKTSIEMMLLLKRYSRSLMLSQQILTDSLPSKLQEPLTDGCTRFYCQAQTKYFPIRFVYIFY